MTEPAHPDPDAVYPALAPPDHVGSSVASTSIHQLDPRIITVWRLRTILGWGPVFIGALVAANRLPAGWTLAVGGFALANYVFVVMWWPRTRWRHWTWKLSSLALELRHGVIVRRREALPYFRIQQIDISSGPVDRLLGLTTLQVSSASSTGTAIIPGIETAAAQKLRQELLARSAATLTRDGDEARDAV